jgi:hypothetical protein
MIWSPEQALADVETLARLAGVTLVFATWQKIPNGHSVPLQFFGWSMARSGTALARRRDRPRVCGNSNFENLERTVSSGIRLWRPESERNFAVAPSGELRSGADHA